MGTEKMTVEAAQEAMFFMDSKSESSGRWHRGPRKEIFYAGESWGPEKPEDEDFPSNYLDVHFLSEDESWLDFDQDYYDQPAEDYGEAVEVYDVDEYDDVYSAYVDAKNKMNQMRTARGFFPVVAMIGGGGGSYGKKDGRKGSGKKFKGRPKGPGPGGGKGKQMPKPGPSSPSGKGTGCSWETTMPSMWPTWTLGTELSSEWQRREAEAAR